MNSETIFALATPYGKSAIAIIRLSGSHTIHTLKKITKRAHFQPRMFVYTPIYDSKGNIVDKVGAIYFQNPHSYTGEDSAELHIHGSMYVAERILDILQNFPHHRLATRGEFTKRAFLAGKLDLMEAEGVLDLIESNSEESRKLAVSHLNGDFSNLIHTWQHTLINLMVPIEASLSFPDDVNPTYNTTPLNILIECLQKALGDHKAGEITREGLRVALVGPPNSGKSTLFNTLLKRDMAMVSEIPGTTRDVLEYTVNIQGISVIFQDTAGIRNATDALEKQGITRGKNAAKAAHLVCIIVEATQPIDSISTYVPQNKPYIIVANKADLLKNSTLPTACDVLMSLKTMQGFENFTHWLVRDIKTHLANSWITRPRHRQLLQSALSHLLKSQAHTEQEIVLYYLQHATRALEELTGKLPDDAVMDVIFSEFCIGK